MAPASVQPRVGVHDARQGPLGNDGGKVGRDPLFSKGMYKRFFFWKGRGMRRVDNDYDGRMEEVFVWVAWKKYGKGNDMFMYVYGLMFPKYP